MQTTILNEKQSPKTHLGVASTATTTLQKPPKGDAAVPEAMPPLPLPDAREQLFNGGEIGPDLAQVPTEGIVKLNGILFDIDPTILRESPLLPELSHDLEQFYEDCVRRWLANNALLDNAEVRNSGTGLDVILWLNPPIEFADDAERKRWCLISKIVQATLATNPLAPAIATTRPIGSINTKNGRLVRRLKEGNPVPPSDVIELKEQMCAAPFKTLFQVLIGSDRMSPCPFCGNATLVALNNIGKCCGCGQITFEWLCNELFQQQKSAGA